VLLPCVYNTVLEVMSDSIHCVPKLSTYILVITGKNQPILIIFGLYKFLKKSDAIVYKIAHHTLKCHHTNL